MKKIVSFIFLIAFSALAQSPIGPVVSRNQGLQSFNFTNGGGFTGTVSTVNNQVTFSLQLNAGSIALAQMASLSNATVIGRKTAGTGVPEAISASDILDFIGNTRGSVIFRGVSGWSLLTPGTSGYILKSQGAGSDPHWVADDNEKSANKDQPSGYAGLTAGGKLNSSELPSTVELIANKGAVSGYAPLNGSSIIDRTYLGSGGTGGGAKALFDDGTFKSVAGGGSVVDVAIATANGVSGSSDHNATTPTITLALGAITPTSIVASGTISGSNLSGTNTGDQTITLTSDVTGSGIGSFVATIAANAVTYAKLQQVGATSLLGNPTGSTANASEITIGGGGKLEGTTLKFYNSSTTLSGGSPAADAATSKSFLIVMSTNPTFTFSNFNDGDTILIRCQQAASGGPYSPTFPTVTWGGGSQPSQTTTASKSNLYFFTKQGTTIYARMDSAVY